MERKFIAMLIVIAILTAVIIFNFLVLVVKESNRMVFPRIQILSLRIAAFLPFFAIIFIFKFIFVEVHLGIDVVETFVEGYCVYCFYKMQVYYIGSRENVITVLKNSTQKFGCLSGVEKVYPEWYLAIGEFLLLQFLFIRPFYTLALALVDRGKNRNIFVLFTILQIASLVCGMIGLLRLSFILCHHTRRLGAMKKLFFLKAVILMIVLENLIANIIDLRG